MRYSSLLMTTFLHLTLT